MTPHEALQVERDMLQGLVAAAPRGRPEILVRLQRVTAELLKLELMPAPLRPVPEFTPDDDQALKWYQK